MGKQKIVLPLDVNTAEKAVALVETLKDNVAALKVGLGLANSAVIGARPWCLLSP